jgi:hypothetical protein
MSENPYKGIPGGDPRLRAAHFKTLVDIAFICATCNQEKTEKFPEGKDLTGRACPECRNIESIRKQKIRDEENRVRWEEYRRKERNRPNRTKEEKLALIAEYYASSPRETCGPCGNTYFIENPKFPFSNDNVWKDNAILTVSYRMDPYDIEIHGTENPNWFCTKCYHEIELDI